MMHLWAIAIGAVAVGLPLAVHFLTKARPVKAPLSTIRFVQEAVHQRKARHRLRDFLVLACRVAAIVLIALAFARPAAKARQASGAAEAGGIERIVVLDVSASMGATVKGATLFERARARAANYLRFEPGLKANVILAGARAKGVFDRASPNVGELSEQVGRAAVTGERLNLSAAITLAGEMLSKGPERVGVRREVVIVSDLQRTNWAAANFEALPKDAAITLESVAARGEGDKGETPGNVAIVSAGFAGRASAGQESRVEVEVANFSRSPQKVRANVTVEGKTYPLEQEVSPGGRARMSVPVVMAASGWHVGDVRLSGVEDALAADNVRAIAVRVLPAPAYLLVTRQGPEPRPVSSHYLQLALANRGAKSEQVTRLGAAQVDREAIAGADVVVLDHPGKLDAAAIQLLAGSLRRGKSILYVASEPADATNLKLLADAAGTDLRMPVEFRPAAGAKSHQTLGEIRKYDPVFAIFGEQLQVTVDALRFSTMLTSERTKDGVVDDVVASYADRSAFLVVTDVAGGTLAVMNADLSNSTVTSTGAFVAMLGELTNRMVGKRSSPPAGVAGEAGALSLGGDVGNVSELKVVGADGKASAMGTVQDEQGAAVWRWTGPAAGGYKVTRGDAVLGAVAVGVSAEESDLTPIDEELVKTRLAGGREIHFVNDGDDERSEDHAWVWLAIAAGGCLVIEVLVLRGFRS